MSTPPLDLHGLS